ncbi:ATP-binding protein [Streptomyces sp. NPDC001514]
MGRDQELSWLSGLLADVERGSGGSVLVEGAPGIGKSGLVAQALASAAEGLDGRAAVLRGSADEFCVNLPFQLMSDLLRTTRPGGSAVAPSGPRSPSGVPAADPIAAGVEATVAEFERLCMAGPVVVAVTDLQWADRASLTALAALARLTEQLPLLLMGDLSRAPRRAEVGRLRRALLAHGGRVITLERLSPEESARLAGEFLGAPVGPGLRAWIEQAGGNPLHVRELALALQREGYVRLQDGVAESWPSADRAESLPPSLSAAIADRIGFLSPDTLEVLRAAGVLGSACTLAELSAVLDWPDPRVTEALEEAEATGILSDTDQGLRFSSPLLRLALYESMPAAIRGLRHEQTARVLAEAGLAPERIALQLAQTETPGGWVVDWLVETAPTLIYRAPEVAVDLLGRVLREQTGDEPGKPSWDPAGPALTELAWDDPRREPLEAVLATAAFLRGEYERAEDLAQRVLARTDDGDRAGEMTWLLGRALMRQERYTEAIEVVTSTGRRWRLDPVWDARLCSMHGPILFFAGLLEESRAVGEDALERGRRLADAQSIAYASAMLAMQARVTHDTERVTPHLEEGLTAADETPELTDCRLILLGTKSQWQMERGMPDETVAETIRLGRRVAERAGSTRVGVFAVLAAVLAHKQGYWDDALAELEVFPEWPDANSWAIAYHGLSALIAVQRDRLSTAHEHLAQCPDGLAATDPFVRVCAVHSIRARALLAEREGRRDEALAMLEETVTDAYAAKWFDRHVWMPFLARTAVEAGRTDLAAAAAEAARKDVARDARPDRVAAAQQCAGLVSRDPGPLREALARYQETSRVPDAVGCAEDLAWVLAVTGDPEAAKAAMHEAAQGYIALGAVGELARADARWRAAGLRRGVQGARKRPATGPASLTPTEQRVAELVAEGLSNPDIADRLHSSRRTVQTHVSRILGKLGMRSRTEIVHALATGPEQEGHASHH